MRACAQGCWHMPGAAASGTLHCLWPLQVCVPSHPCCPGPGLAGPGHPGAYASPGSDGLPRAFCSLKDFLPKEYIKQKGERKIFMVSLQGKKAERLALGPYLPSCSRGPRRSWQPRARMCCATASRG